MTPSQPETAFERAFHQTAERHERVWVFFVLAMLALLLVGTMFYVVYDYGVITQGDRFFDKPEAALDDAAFRDGAVMQTGPSTYEVHMVAHAWAWSPGVIHVKQGARVTFYVTSSDVLHGFEIQDTTVNVTAMPGAVSKVTYTFGRAGTYHIVCNEYCGVEHHSMIGLVVVDPEDAS